MKSVLVFLFSAFSNLLQTNGQGCQDIFLDNCRSGTLCEKREKHEVDAEECQSYCNTLNAVSLCDSFSYNTKTEVSFKLIYFDT